MDNITIRIKFTNHSLQGCETCVVKNKSTACELGNSTNSSDFSLDLHFLKFNKLPKGNVVKSRKIHRFIVTQKLHQSRSKSCERNSSFLRSSMRITAAQHPLYWWLTPWDTELTLQKIFNFTSQVLSLGVSRLQFLEYMRRVFQCI